MSIAFNDTLTEESAADDCCVRSNESRQVRRALLTESAVDPAAIKGAVRTILRAVGEDPDRDGLLETPRRVAKIYAEMFSGLFQDPGSLTVTSTMRGTFRSDPASRAELMSLINMPS